VTVGKSSDESFFRGVVADRGARATVGRSGLELPLLSGNATTGLEARLPVQQREKAQSLV
jgi:hypothetical protein